MSSNDSFVDGGGGSDGGSTSPVGDPASGSSGSSIPSVGDIIDRLFRDYPFLKAIANDPRAAIMGVVVTWVVNRITGAAEFGINFIVELGTLWGDTVVVVWDALVSPLSLGFGSVEALVGAVAAANASVAAGFGAFSPAVLMALFAVEALGVLLLLDLAVRSGVGGVLGSLPIVGTVFSGLAQVYIVMQNWAGKLYEVMFRS